MRPVSWIGKEPIGLYSYNKRLKSGEMVPCMVEVLPLKVKSERKRWPEKGQRTTRWFLPEAAAEAVDEAGLSETILKLRSLMPLEVEGLPWQAERRAAAAKT